MQGLDSLVKCLNIQYCEKLKENDLSEIGGLFLILWLYVFIMFIALNVYICWDSCLRVLNSDRFYINTSYFFQLKKVWFLSITFRIFLSYFFCVYMHISSTIMKLKWNKFIQLSMFWFRMDYFEKRAKSLK